MARFCFRVLIAVGLLATGWIAAQAQSANPDFELIVEAPGGATSIRCVRGCNLAWVERGVNLNSRPIDTFDFYCSAPRCSSAKVGGWVAR